MTTEVLQIQIREDGSRVVKKNIEAIGDSSKKAAGDVDILKNALAALAAFLSVREVVRMTNAWTDMSSRVRIAVGDIDQGRLVMQRLTEMARRTYSSLEQTAETYLLNATAMRELGYSTQTTLDYVEAVNNALVVSGAKGQVAESVMNALSKAMAGGALRGENLNTVIEKGGRVAEVLAASLGVSTNQLRQLGQDGKITSDVIANAMTGALETLREEADSMPATIGDAFVLLGNAIMKQIGLMDQAAGASAELAQAIIWVADNIDMVTSAVITFGAAFAPVFAGAIMMKAYSMLMAFFALINAHPLMLLVSALSAAVVGFGQFADRLTGLDKATLKTVTAFDRLVATWVGMKAAFEAVMSNIENVMKEFPKFTGNIAIEAANLFLKGFAWMVNKGYELWAFFINKVANALNLGNVLQEQLNFKLELPTFDTPQITQTAQHAGNAFMNAYTQAIKDAAARNAIKGTIDNKDNPITPINANDAKKAKRELDQLRNSLNSLRSALDPIWGAQLAVAEAQDVLNKSVQKGLITDRERADLLQKVAKAYEDQLDPLAALNRELDESFGLLKLNNRERAIEADVLQSVKQLREAGLEVGAREINQIRERIQLLQKENDIASMRDSIRDDVMGPSENLANGTEAIRQLMESYPEYADQFEQKLLDLQYAALEGSMTIGDGFERGFIQIQKRMTDMASLSEELVTKSFSAAEDAVVNFVKTGEFSLEDFSSMFLEMTTRMLTRWIMMQAMGIFSGGMAGGGGGGFLGGLMGFEHGGSFKVGGQGGTDSQLVAFRASPNETVTVTRPEQAAQSAAPAEVNVPVQVINVTDPREALNAMSTTDGTRIIMNAIQQNSASVKKLLGG